LERRVSDSVMSRKKQRDDKVIHVVFGPGGGRVERLDPKAIDTQAEPQSGREPLTDLFSGTEIARLLDVTPARLRTLDRAGVVSPSGRRRGRRAYTFGDLIALRTLYAAVGLLVAAHLVVRYPLLLSLVALVVLARVWQRWSSETATAGGAS